MKNKHIILAIILFFSQVSGIWASEIIGAKAAEKSNNPSLEDMLTYAIQDEYLARAEYAVIIEKHGAVRPFTNIIKAEENHIRMLEPLFEKYGFALPEDSSDKHVIIPENLKTAFETGVQAEIDNISMYESFLNRTLPEDVRDVFIRLKKGSENHLRAFKNGLSKY